jgi:hypothetical protein
LISESDWSSARFELDKLAYLVSPMAMLNCLTDVAKKIYSEAAIVDPVNVMGGDDFMDVMCFVVLRCGVPNLASIIAFIELFVNDDHQSEMQYYLTVLKSALSFVLEIKSLPMSKK